MAPRGKQACKADRCESVPKNPLELTPFLNSKMQDCRASGFLMTSCSPGAHLDVFWPLGPPFSAAGGSAPKESEQSSP